MDGKLNAVIRIDNGTGKIKELPVSSYKDMRSLKCSVECMLHLYAGSRERTESIHTETTYPDGEVEKKDFLCYQGRLIADSVMSHLLGTRRSLT